MRRFMFACLAVAAALAASPALATATVGTTNYVTNGTFSQTTATTSQQMSADGSIQNAAQYVTGWVNTPTSCAGLPNCDLSGTTAGYNFIVLGNQGTQQNGIQSNDNGALYLWGKTSDAANAKSNGFTLSNSIGGSGGNYIAADGAYEQSIIYQVIGGLTAGQTYQLTFNFAGAQQHGFNGATTEAWTAYFTDLNNVQSYTTKTLQNVDHGFTGWQTASTIFTATNSTEILGFVASGTPNGQPPFSLLDDVALRAYSSAPEPASWAMMIGGFGLIGRSLRRQRARATSQA